MSKALDEKLIEQILPLIERLREECGMSDRDIADALNLYPESVSKWKGTQGKDTARAY